MIGNTEALEANYRTCAEAYGAAYMRGDHKVTNRNYDKLTVLVAKLRTCGEKGEAILRRLMKDESDAIAMCAATHSLPFAERDALDVLDSIARRGGVIGFSAETTVKEWKSGRLTIC